ncbi:rhodanese-like domain-containing protein [Candidatus Chloroploca asiatica]|uniref:Sulfurtransferase n=1 Tax=Candidatus Chloroploca asiatica TaxID=1506545 RepID=A0A2H3LB25_9CHLR|nr:rhodanese-like domain-containing protein [Candidatus Chloroploca asiatica]PDV99598.1 sulfurtransferase [Candidatus Chloroploca asiatica]
MLRNLFQGGSRSATGPATIDVKTLKQRLDQGENLLLVDVRSGEEYTYDGRIAGSRLLPLPMLANRIEELPQDQPIICVCRSGNRSGVACEQLSRKGFTNVTNLSGGMMAWARAGFPMDRG